MKNCLLIDGNNIVFRAFYAFGSQRLSTSSGLHTGALYGFVRMLTKVLKEKNPDLVAVAFDTTSNTFRKKKYPEYKAQRKPVPEDLLMQLPWAHDATRALGITVLTSSDYEADDLIGSTAKRLSSEYNVEIITGDRDLLQLIDDNITVDLCHKGVTDMKSVNRQAFIDEYGFEPKGIIDLKALWGDTSDNIPGVSGIGEKKGMSLIQEYKSIENLYNSIDTVSNAKMKQKLLDEKETALLSYYLATIVTDVKTFDTVDELVWHPNNLHEETFLTFLQKYEFGSLYKEFSKNSELTLEKLMKKAELKNVDTINETNGKELSGERIAINNLEDFKTYWNSVGDTICLDIETDGLNFASDRIIGISFAANIEKAIYIPLRHSYLGLTPNDQIEPKSFFDYLKDAIKGKNIIGHNLKFDLAFLKNEGVEVDGKLFDTLIAAYVADPVRSNALKALGKSLLGFEVTEYKQVAKAGEFASVDIKTATYYGCQDVLLTMQLYPILKKEILERGLTDLFEKLEMPLLNILMDMEYTGIGLNKQYMKDLSIKFDAKLRQLENNIHVYAGKPFNINSPKQLSEILFTDLKLTPPKKTKTGYSTDNEVLQILQFEHPICKEIIEYRELAKLKNTYTDALVELINPITGKIHASFNQAVTATGRLSSSNPNLQNIPVKTEVGKQIRKAFIPPREGDVFVSLDYSQIELRLLAHFSQDPELINAYKNNIDIHTLSASKIFGLDPQYIDSHQRSVGKTVNFGIIYGISAHGLATGLGITRIQAKEYIDNFYENFPKVTEYFNEVLEKTRQTGKVSTLFNRIREIPDINSSKALLKAAAERIAKNTGLQGSAADLVKKAMIDTTEYIKSHNLNTKLVLQIHDELIFSVPQEELETIKPELKRIMENCVQLNIPLVCDVAVGKDWSEL